MLARAAGVAVLAICNGLQVRSAAAAEFHSEWPGGIERVWIGPEYWANRLQDWRLHDGRLECVEASARRPMRTVHLLVRALSAGRGTLKMTVRSGPIEPDGQPDPRAWVGFLIGAGGQHVDYRLTALVHHRPAEDGGLLAALDGAGRITFRDNSVGRKGRLLGPLTEGELPELSAIPDQVPRLARAMPAEVRLELNARPVGAVYTIEFAAYDSASGELINAATLANVEAKKLEGSLALVSHLTPTGGRRGYWFRDWRVGGSKVVAHPERATRNVTASFGGAGGKTASPDVLPVPTFYNKYTTGLSGVP